MSCTGFWLSRPVPNFGCPSPSRPLARFLAGPVVPLSRDNEGTSVPLSRKVALSRPIGNPISNTYFFAGQLSTTQYTCSKPESDGSTTTSKFDFKRIQGNSGQCEVTETVKNPQKKQEFAKLSIDKCSWVPKCYSAGPSKKFSLNFWFRPTTCGSRGKF